MTITIYRLDVFYKSGRIETPTFSDEAKAQAMKKKYEALPTVNAVALTPVERRVRNE